MFGPVPEERAPLHWHKEKGNNLVSMWWTGLIDLNGRKRENNFLREWVTASQNPMGEEAVESPSLEDFKNCLQWYGYSSPCLKKDKYTAGLFQSSVFYVLRASISSLPNSFDQYFWYHFWSLQLLKLGSRGNSVN